MAEHQQNDYTEGNGNIILMPDQLHINNENIENLNEKGLDNQQNDCNEGDGNIILIPDQLHINNEDIEDLNEEGLDNQQNDYNEDDGLKPKWMNAKPPKRLSGPLLTLVMILLFQIYIPNLDYQELPENFNITEDDYEILQRELQENHLPTSFLNVVTKKSIDKQVATLRAQANLSVIVKGSNKLKKEEKDRQEREQFSIKYKAEKIQKVEDISLISKAKVNVQEVNTLIEYLSTKSTHHDRDISRVRILYDEYLKDGNELSNSAKTNGDCVSLAICYDDSIMQLMSLLKNSNADVDWVKSYFDAFKVENIVEAHRNEGCTFPGPRGPKKGYKRKLISDNVSEFRGGLRQAKRYIDYRSDTLVQKLFEMSTVKNQIAESTQSKNENELLFLQYDKEDAKEIANNEDSVSYLNDSNHEDILNTKIDHLVHQLANAFQERLKKENNKNNGMNLTDISKSENILLILDPLVEKSDVGVAIGANASIILPNLLLLLKAGVQDDRQYLDKKKKSILLKDADIPAIIEKCKKRFKRNKNNKNENFDDADSDSNSDGENDQGDETIDNDQGDENIDNDSVSV